MMLDKAEHGKMKELELLALKAGAMVPELRAGAPSGSADSISQASDPLPSWVADSQVVDLPPALLAKSGVQEGQSIELGLMEDESFLVDNTVEQPREDLQKALKETTPVAQGRRTKTIEYARRKKKVASMMPTRKSARFTGVQASTPILERAMRRAEEKDMDGVSTRNDEQELEGTGQSKGQGPAGRAAGRG
jgi:antitoxin component of MazEF toxin-antitoxin module